MLPVVEMFTSIQGEGIYTGVPSIFIRVSGCNLRCVFKDSVCDTPYSSFCAEKPIANTQLELIDKFNDIWNKHPNINHIVITGGEPLMYSESLSNFLRSIYRGGMVITIETNGTYDPLEENGFYINLYSVSPKLSNSVGKPGVYSASGNCKVTVTQNMIDSHNSRRINLETLSNIINRSLDANGQLTFQFKFVYSSADTLKEIDEMYEKLGQMLHVNVSYIDAHTMLMPEGITNEQLAVHRKEIVDICLKRGWRMTDREHIIIWGDERGV